MASYRLYPLNDLGHVTDAVEFLRADDEAAQTEAAKHLSGGPAELWSLARVVRKYSQAGDAA